MDTNRLRYFVLVAEVGSLTQASQLLGISHSGLSKAISALESEIERKLFRARGRGLEITAEGKWLYPKAVEILRLTSGLKQPSSVIEPEVLRLALSEILSVTCAGELAKEFSEALHLRALDVGELEESILHGEVDFGISFIPAPKPELEYLLLGELAFAAFAREDLLNNSKIPPYAYPAQPVAANPIGFNSRDGWPTDLYRSHRYAVSSFAMALELLRAGRAALYMPEYVANFEKRIVPVLEHRAARTKRKLYLVKKQNSDETRAMKRAAKVIRRICF